MVHFGSVNIQDRVSTMIKRIIAQEQGRLQIQEYAFLDSDKVIFSDEVRAICEKNSCRMYGTSWACPPAVGSVAQCKEICSQFENAFIFTSLTQLKQKYNMEEWLEARIVHEAITEKVAAVFRSQFEKTLILSTEGCTICKTCAYPDKCRFPERMFPATESFGILVMKLAPLCNIKYNNGPQTITYFSMVFF